MDTIYGPREPLRTLGTELDLSRVPWECLENPGFRAICRALALEAPELVDQVVVITSNHRTPALGSAQPFSYHWRFAAADWRTGLYLHHPGTHQEKLVLHGSRPGAIVAPTAAEALEIAKAWGARARARLGSEFDLLIGDRNHIDHGHLEHDARKAARVYERTVST